MNDYQLFEIPTRPFPGIIRWAFVGGCLWGVLFVLLAWWWLG